MLELNLKEVENEIQVEPGFLRRRSTVRSKKEHRGTLQAACKAVPAQGKGAQGDSGGEAGGTGGDLVPRAPACMSCRQLRRF